MTPSGTSRFSPAPPALLVRMPDGASQRFTQPFEIGRGETSELDQMQARVNYDLDYLRQWSPTLDLRILIRTAVQLVRGDKRAY